MNRKEADHRTKRPKNFVNFGPGAQVSSGNGVGVRHAFPADAAESPFCSALGPGPGPGPVAAAASGSLPASSPNPAPQSTQMQLVTSKMMDMQMMRAASESMSMSVSSSSASGSVAESTPGASPSPGGGGVKVKYNQKTMYHQKAMDEIRMSLEPFANKSESASSTTTSGIGSASAGSSPCPSTQNGALSMSMSMSLSDKQHQMQQAFGYDEDQMRAYNANVWDPQLDMQSKLHCEGFGLALGLGHGVVHGHNLQNGLHKPSSGHLSALYGGNRRRATTQDEDGFGKIIRKHSFDRDHTPSIGRYSASPALDSSTASTRSDSPSVRTQGDPPRLISQPPTDSIVGHVPVSRQYSPNFAMEPPPPPPPPRPRAPPPPPQSPLAVSARGTTPPPPLPPTSSSSAASASQQQPDFRCGQPTTAFIMKRISPVYTGGSSSQSSTATSQRGTSPVSLARAPMIVPSFMPAQQQFVAQQFQAILYNGNAEPPPPYPMPSSSSKLRQSPTQLQPPKRTTPGGAAGGGNSPSSFLQQIALQQAVSPQQAVAVSGVATSTAVGGGQGQGQGQRTGSLAPMQAWNARHPPIIMQSVKSTQVPKPVLQTAIAPAAPSSSVSSGGQQQQPPPPAPPPPSYSTALQQMAQMETQQSSSSSSSSACTTPTFAAIPPHPDPPAPPLPVRPQSPAVVGGGGGGSGLPVAVPTTDPPSYASAMQEFAAQRGMPSVTATTTTASLVGLASYGLQPFGFDTVSQVDHHNSTNHNHNHAGGNSHSHRHHYHHHNQQQPPPHLHRKFSPKPAPSASRAESPASSSSSSSPATVAGQAAQSPAVAPEDKGPPPSPPPPPQKITLHSPIPERRAHLKESDEERTIVRVYSPQAYKFYMEQHIENVINSYQERIRRKLQLEQEMAKVGLSEEAQCQMRRMLHQKESNYIRQKRAKMDKSMFSKLKTIGVGAFGEVALVLKKDTPQYLYAMKTLRKSDVLKRNQVAHVKAERDILAEADNEWVVKLYYSFQDKDNLYFVMDYVPGGDLMSLLIKLNIFHEPLARFYIAELLCAIESVHKMGFIHRDIKPDNILIDRDGHIKLTDFGLCTGFRWTHNSKYYQRNGEHGRQDSMDPDENWSNDCKCNVTGSAPTVLKPLERRRRREHQRCLAHSLVGTPNYIAPEVLMRTGYTQLCDWWSVGVILYEMLVGQPPFLADNPAVTQYKVINWETTLHIPKHANLSPEAKDLILKLCTSHDKRLGKNGATEVKSHPFFLKVDFEGGLRRQQAPYVPTVKHATDTSNFDPVDPDKLRNSDDEGGERADQSYDNGKHPEHAFYEFTFRRFFDDGGHAYPFRDGFEDSGDTNQGPVYV